MPVVLMEISITGLSLACSLYSVCYDKVQSGGLKRKTIKTETCHSGDEILS